MTRGQNSQPKGMRAWGSDSAPPVAGCVPLQGGKCRGRAVGGSAAGRGRGKRQSAVITSHQSELGGFACVCIDSAFLENTWKERSPPQVV